MVAGHMLRAVDVLRGVQRLRHRDALAPSLGVWGGHIHEKDVAFGLDTERRPERRDERQPNTPERDLGELHRALTIGHSARRGRGALTGSAVPSVSPAAPTGYGGPNPGSVAGRVAPAPGNALPASIEDRSGAWG